jgi:hypothetical protein
LELLVSFVFFVVLAKWSFNAIFRKSARTVADRRAEGITVTNLSPPAAPQTLSQIRYAQLQRELVWSRHRQAAATPPRPFDAASKSRSLQRAAAEKDPIRARHFLAQGEIEKRAWEKHHSEMERERLRGPETDEEHAFDAAARSSAAIEAELAALPVPRVMVDPIPMPDADALRKTARLLFKITLATRRNGGGYSLNADLTHENGLGTGKAEQALGIPPGVMSRTDSLSKAAHPCLISSISVRERQYYDWIMRSDREYTHFAWSITASHALHDVLVSELLGALSTDERDKLDRGGLYTTAIAAFLEVPTSLRTGLCGRKLSEVKDIYGLQPVGEEQLTSCTLHLQPNLGREGYGAITRSLRLTEIAPP